MQKIHRDLDFVNLKRFGFSLQMALKRYPQGCPDRIIAQALSLSEVEVEERYSEIIERIQMLVGEIHDY